MTLWIRRALLVVLILVASSLGAQGIGSFDDFSGRMKSGEPVLIAEASGSMTAGRLAQLSHDSMLVRTSEGERQVKFVDISEVAVQRRSTGRGLLIGSAAGLLAGALSEECRGDNSPQAISFQASCGEAVSMYGLAGAGIGALTGAFISHTVIVYRSPNAKVQVSPTDWPNAAAGVRVRW